MEPVRLLIAEDRPTDAELAEREIKKVLEACIFKRVETREDYIEALEAFRPDLIVSDYNMPRFDGLTALHLAMAQPHFIPVIIVTTAINEDTAVSCMKAGATDYVIKEHRKRLGQAVIHALEEKQLRQERQRAEEALRESEARFRGLYENVSIGLIRTTPSGEILLANPAAVRMLGYDSFAELAQRNMNEEGVGPVVAYSEFRDWLEREESISGLETAWHTKNGEVIYVREGGNAIRSQQGQILYYDNTLEDITRRKQAEEAKTKLELQLRQAQKMESIGLLAGSIAHDFNNLLTVIAGYCDLIRDQITAEDPVREDVDQIRLAGERAAALTRQLLAFSRKQIMAPSVLDLTGLIENLRKMLERLIGADILLNTVLEPQLQSVVADPGQIEQVIMNLVVNARDAMPDGGELTIEASNIFLDDSYASAHFEGPTGHCIMIAVSDTGSGMDAETQARIFEPFFTTKEPGRGTGLGLSTVYGIVKQSGGNITVYSEPGHGTTFKIYLPVSSVAAAHHVAPAAKSADTHGSETILLVEDNESMRKLMLTVLRDRGYNVLAAQRPKEALGLVETQPRDISLLMTDVVLPQMSGRDLAERLKVQFPLLRVLFMSGFTDETAMRRGMLDADVAFLPKPFAPHTLLTKVREMLDS